jgi:UDP-N-acetylmuramate dehydrogenase
MLEYLKKNIDITNLSNFKTKALTKYYYEINSEDDLLNIKDIFQFTKKENLKTLFI